MNMISWAKLLNDIQSIDINHLKRYLELFDDLENQTKP